MRIAGFAAALFLSFAALGGQTRNLPEPSRLATFLAATKKAVATQSLVGELSAEISRGWPPGEKKKSRATFFAIVARDPGFALERFVEIIAAGQACIDAH